MQIWALVGLTICFDWLGETDGGREDRDTEKHNKNNNVNHRNITNKQDHGSRLSTTMTYEGCVSVFGL